MLEGLREALQYVVGLGVDKEKPEIVEICGKTYANKELVRYDNKNMALPIKSSSLSSLVEYIADCFDEFPNVEEDTEGLHMIIHVESPKRVRLLSSLDKERKRECLFEANAETSEFAFGKWYDQERFMIELQANFQQTGDLDLVLKVACNVECRNDQTFSDDGRSQVVTMNVGVASRADALVPNPVELTPFRTFQEVEQPSSKFVFRIGKQDEPTFSLIEAENGIWKNEAVENIKEYLRNNIGCLPEEISSKITIIG